MHDPSKPEFRPGNPGVMLDRGAAFIPGASERTSAVAHAKPARSLLIDIVRGISISLVALGHTNQGILHRGWWGTSSVGLEVDHFIYAFHMPAFFFVSGVFLLASVQRRGPAGFTGEKLRTILYPYLFWAVLFALTPLLFGRFMEKGVPSLPFFLESVATGSASWFLPTILFVVIMGMLLRRVPLPALFLLTSVASFTWPGVGLVYVDRGVQHLPFLVAGMWAGRRVERIERLPAAAALIVAGVLAVVIAFATSSRWVYSPYLFIPLGLLGTLMLLLIGRCLTRSVAASLLAWIGAGSLGIFLLSAYFQGGGRELLLFLFHTREPYLQLLFPTLLAILIPAWLYGNRVRLHIDWMFVWPFHHRLPTAPAGLHMASLTNNFAASPEPPAQPPSRTPTVLE